MSGTAESQVEPQMGIGRDPSNPIEPTEKAPAATVDPSSVRSVRRALDILALLNEERTTLTIKDTTAATGLPKTTVLRLLQTLEQAGLLWSLGGGQYVPGPALLRWARIANDTWLFPPDFRELLNDLAQRCRETANVYVRKGLKRVCIAQAPGPQSLRHVVRVGDELPLWAGASAKILLTNAQVGLLEKVALDSPFGISHLAQLEQWTNEIKERGWATSHAERDDGVSAVAVPILASNGTYTAALSLSGPSSRFTEDQVEFFIEQLQATAEKMAGHNDGGMQSQHILLARSND